MSRHYLPCEPNNLLYVVLEAMELDAQMQIQIYIGMASILLVNSIPRNKDNVHDC